MTIENYFALFIAMFVVAAIPGPAVFAITSASITSGFKRGALMTLGLVLADYIFIILAISGLSFVAELMGEAFIFLKYLCAAYLIWMGLMLFISNPPLQDQDPQSNYFLCGVVSGFCKTGCHIRDRNNGYHALCHTGIWDR